MKRLILLLILLPSIVLSAGPRSWGKSGTATVANAVLTVGSTSASFYPSALCVANLDATDDIFIDWTDGVAATTDNTTNQKITPGKTICFNFNNPDVLNLMEVGIIASANTPAYNINAIAYR